MGGPEPDFTGRSSRLLAALDRQGLDSLLVTHPPNLTYLFGFTGTQGLGLITEAYNRLIVDSRYIEQAEEETRNCNPVLAKDSLENCLRQVLKDLKPSQRLGIEASHLVYSQVEELRNWELQLDIIPTTGLVEGLRVSKETVEIAALKQAFRIANTALDRFLSDFPVEVAETEAAGLLEYYCRQAGSEGLAFETIVASGARSALPHGLASGRILSEEDIVLIDFGIRYQGYCSDMTRMRIPQDADAHSIYQIVREAQEAAFDAIAPGIPACEVDAAARRVIQRHGFAHHFGHGTGHGIGLEIHEQPHISPRSTETLQAGMVFSVEPGIYLPGRFGVRYEDVVVVRDSGWELLSR